MFTELSDKGTFSLEIFSGNPDRLSVTVKHHPALSSVCVCVRASIDYRIQGLETVYIFT